MPQDRAQQPINIGIHLPGCLDLAHDNLSVHFEKWKDALSLYLKASGISKQDNETKSAVILHTAGSEVIKLVRHFTYAEGQNENDPEVLLGKIEAHCNSKTNEVMQAFRFNQLTLKPGQSFDTFLVELRSHAKSCNFADTDRMIRDKIVFSVKGQLQQALLREKNLNLEKCLNICRTAEATEKHCTEMAPSSSAFTPQIDKVFKKPSTNRDEEKHLKRYETPSQRSETQPVSRGNIFVYDCKFCGRDHQRGKHFCPAYGKTCSKCNGRNHFKLKCRTVNYCAQTLNDVDSDSASDDAYLHSITHKSDRGIAALLKVNDCDVRFQLDTGADVDTICQQYVRKDQVMPSKQQLTMWNHSTLKPVGEATLTVFNPKSNV